MQGSSKPSIQIYKLNIKNFMQNSAHICPVEEVQRIGFRKELVRMLVLK